MKSRALRRQMSEKIVSTRGEYSAEGFLKHKDVYQIIKIVKKITDQAIKKI